MKDWAIAFAIVGIAASVSYCTVSSGKTLAARQQHEMELCDKQGGKWTQSGWGDFCDFTNTGADK